jgi:hypothetical protein
VLPSLQPAQFVEEKALRDAYRSAAYHIGFALLSEGKFDTRARRMEGK